MADERTEKQKVQEITDQLDKVVKERQVERQGIFLTNYVMIKEQ